MPDRRRLNNLASLGGGDRSAIAKVAKRGSSPATTIAHRYAEHFIANEISQLSFDDPEELVTIGTRVGVPASHPNKYGYATTALIVNVSRRQ